MRPYERADLIGRLCTDARSQSRLATREPESPRAFLTYVRLTGRRKSKRNGGARDYLERLASHTIELGARRSEQSTSVGN